MVQFEDRFRELYDEEKKKCKAAKELFGFNSLGEYFASIGVKLGSSTLSGYYNAADNNPTLDRLNALAEYFGVSVSYLIGESDCRSLKSQHTYEELKEYGFTVDMVESLKQIKELPSVERNNCVNALGFLLAGFDENDPFALLKSIGNYLARLNDTGRKTVLSSDLDDIKQIANSTEINHNELKLLLNNLTNHEKDYSTDDLDAYLISDITSKLKSVRQILDNTERIIWSKLNDELHRHKRDRKSTLEDLMKDTCDSEIDISLSLENN